MNTPSRPNRPHVLFLMDDEHRADVAGYAGDPVARTPVLDELARTGVVFTNAYTPAPICIPARQSLAAGQLPHTTGCERYGEDLPPGHMTFARRFAQYGYQTVACGKLHHDGVDQMQGWLRRYGADIAMDPGLVPGRIEPIPVPMDLKWPQDKEVRRAGPGRASHEIDDEYAVQGALDYLDRHFVDSGYDRALPDTPLLLKVSLNQPHYPYITARADRFDYYLNRVTPYAGQSLFDHPFLGGACRVRAGEEVSERDLRRATAAYYAMVETTDERFGRVLDAIRHAGQDPDDWLIVYTSDHGEMLGEHGVFEKQKFFEGSVRVPLIVRWPRRFQARTVDRNVSLCDLFATLCELAGIDVPVRLDSRSLVPLLHGDDSGWDNEAVSEFQARNLMIKRDHLKYQSYGPGMPEVLFDLRADPGELRNAIDDVEHADAVAGFQKRRDELGFS
ncbi:sulfatase-like hydrolase/transferase [Streptomyces sp. NPDC002520]